MTESLPTLLTSQTEMEQLFGAEAVLWRVDDDEDDVKDAGVETEGLNDAMLEAHDQVMMHLEPRYATVDLLDNRWARRAATVLACYFLSQRRGNAEQYVTHYQQIQEDLARLMEGKLSLPRMTVALDEAPAMSNLVVDDRYHYAKLREQSEISEGTTDGSQDLDAPLLLE